MYIFTMMISSISTCVAIVLAEKKKILRSSCMCSMFYLCCNNVKERDRIPFAIYVTVVYGP
jgi:hypothetical protein